MAEDEPEAPADKPYQFGQLSIALIECGGRPVLLMLRVPNEKAGSVELPGTPFAPAYEEMKRLEREGAVPMVNVGERRGPLAAPKRTEAVSRKRGAK